MTMNKTLTIFGVLIALWVGYDQITNNKKIDIQETERRNREMESEQQRKDAEQEREYNLKVAELEKKFAKQDIKEVVDNTKNEYAQELEIQRQQLVQLQTQNSDLADEVRIKADSIRQLITEKEELLNKIKEQDNIIIQKDSLIAFYKTELESLRTKSKEIIDLLREATTLEVEGDNLSSFWNKKSKQSKYYSAWTIYKKLWKNYSLVSAEDSFHSTWKKLKDLGVDLDNGEAPR